MDYFKYHERTVDMAVEVHAGACLRRMLTD